MTFIINAPCKLKKCPWCKERPNLYKKELFNGNHGYRDCYSYYVKCENKNCKINPKTKEYNTVYNTENNSINNACDDWNNRGNDDENKSLGGNKNV